MLDPLVARLEPQVADSVASRVQAIQRLLRERIIRFQQRFARDGVAQRLVVSGGKQFALVFARQFAQRLGEPFGRLR
jgi:hypothetical protein